MINIQRTSSDNAGFIELVKQLDAYLAWIDGDDHAFYNQYNSTSFLKQVVVAYNEQEAVGCGAIREFDEHTFEVKRMYVLPEQRGKGIAKAILTALETWSKELLHNRCILETGKRQAEAIQLYHNAGYHIIPNYGQYQQMDNSVCFEKLL